jgi:hypothetical protein
MGYWKNQLAESVVLTSKQNFVSKLAIQTNSSLSPNKPNHLGSPSLLLSVKVWNPRLCGVFGQSL